MNTGPRSVVGRADLLRLLVRTTPARVELHTDERHWFGFELKAQRRPLPQRGVGEATPTLADSGEVAHRAPPLRMEHVYAVVQRTARHDAAATQPEAAPVDEVPLQRDPQSQTQAPPHQALVPDARLLPALRRVLGSLRIGGLDFERLAGCLAQGQPPRRLPRKSVLRWHPQLIVIFDLSLRLWPYQLDMWRLACVLEQACPATQLSVWFTRAVPQAGIARWHLQDDFPAQPTSAWSWPRPGSRVLLVSDLGLLLGAESEPTQQWQRFVEQLQQTHVQPVALVPLGAEQVSVAWARRLPVHRWSPDSSLQRARGRQAVPGGRPTGLDSLLALMACVRRVDPALLRALRQLSSPAPGNAGLEGAAWCHEDVEADLIAAVRPERVTHLVRPLQHEPNRRRTLAALNTLRRALHGHLDLALEREEDLLWLAYFGGADAADETMEKELHGYLWQLSRALSSASDRQSISNWRGVAQGLLSRADRAIGNRFFNELARLKSALSPGAAQAGAQQRYWLVHEASRHELRLQAEPPRRRQQVLDDALILGSAGVVSVSTRQGVRWWSGKELPRVIAELEEAAELEIDTGEVRVQIAAVERPRGCIDWQVRSGVLRLQGPELCGASLSVERALRELPVIRHARVGQTQPCWRLHLPAQTPSAPGTPAFGVDLYGFYADMLIQGRHGSALQRLRYIEPGVFLMGAPDTELGWYENQGPQHTVRISEGFWLADTACTQGLWQAVMGNIPSLSTSEGQLPVGQVSWNDAIEFLQALETLLPGMQWTLPTEAQWEYACRAGTHTAFSFGDNISPAVVNYNGRQPYAGAQQGEYPIQIVPVKTLPANEWGLYEMHGNVEELCADGLRDYTAETVTDPVGSLDGSAQRAVRGGSYTSGAEYVRSASRSHHSPRNRPFNLGFRLCSRSPSVPVLRGAPSGSSREPRYEVPPARDEPGAVRRLMNRLRSRK